MIARPRRGVALLMVLGVLTITLAIGYAMIRTAGLEASVETNLDRRAAARAAASTGLSLALRNMHLSTWGGVNSELKGDLAEGVRFAATYTAGDARLTASDPEYDRLPLRVTVQSVGTADHPLHPNAPATEQVSAVVELIPRKIQDASARNVEVRPYSVYQWGNQSLELDLPARIEGPLYTQGSFEFMKNYPVEALRPFSGYVDEVALYSKSFSSAQVKALYDAAEANNLPSQYAAFQPMAWWRFDEANEATVAADAVGATPGRYAGAKAGQTVVPFSNANRSVLLDGINDNVRFGSVVPSGSRWSLAIWLRPERLTNTTVRVISSASDTTDWAQDWSLSIVPRDGAHRLRFQWRTLLGLATIDSTTTVPQQQWTFATIVLDGLTSTLYQNGVARGQGFVLSLPSFTTSGRVMVGDVFPGSSRSQFARDQYQRYLAGLADERILTGEVHAPSSAITAETQTLCVDDLKVPIQTVAARSDAPLTVPLNVTSYRLYAGGPVYTVPELSGTIQNRKLAYDPATNPLGLFLVRGDATLEDDVVLHGTLLFDNASARVRIRGDRIQAAPVSLPILEGEDRAYQLPLALVPGDTEVEDSASLISLRGQWLTGATFDFETGSSPMAMQLEGSLVAQRLRVRKRTNWSESEYVWRWLLINFFEQSSSPTGAKYFPQYLTSLGADMSAALTIRRDPHDPAGYVWPDFSRPLIESGTGDAGLRWRLVSLGYND